MRSRRGALVVLTILMLSLLTARPAAAGGPTSVLLVAPDTGRTASLYTGNGDYVKLAELVGAFEAGPVGAEDGAGTGHEQGAGITLTWLMHDVAVWRVDRVFLDAPGGPWISTQAVDSYGDVGDSPGVWHRAERGGDLTALLNRLGVGPRPRTQPPASTPAASPRATSAPAVAAAAPPRGAASVTNPSPTTSGVAWGAAGLILGVVLTLTAFAASRLVRAPARRSRAGVPRLATQSRSGASGGS